MKVYMTIEHSVTVYH